MRAPGADIPGVDYHDCPTCGEHVPSGLACRCGKVWVGGPNADKLLAEDAQRLTRKRMQDGLVLFGRRWKRASDVVWPDKELRNDCAAEYHRLGFYEVAEQIRAGSTVDTAVAAAWQRGMEAAGFVPDQTSWRKVRDSAAWQKDMDAAHKRGVGVGIQLERKMVQEDADRRKRKDRRHAK